MKNSRFTSTLTKKQVREKLQISRSTLSTWLNVRYYTTLKEAGYKKEQHILTPRQLNLLNNLIDLDNEE